jgi:hypothetical protein
MLLVLLCLAHLGAALTPCPPRAAPGAGDAVAQAHAEAAAAARSAGAEDAHPCHEVAPAHALSAPCPCGCGERSAPSPSAARLGFALLACPPATATPDAFGAPALARACLPDAPRAAIDHVPWS